MLNGLYYIVRGMDRHRQNILTLSRREDQANIVS